MKSINPIFLFKILTYLTQIQWIIGFRTDKSQSEIDCSRYANDNQIIDSFPFTVYLNPHMPNSETTLASMNINDGNVYSIRIVNKESVPSTIYCLKHLSKLEIINTSFSDMEEGFPDEIKFFASSLIDLHIDDTKIINLTNEISKLTRLQTLKLSNTSLMSLPDSIGDLPFLNFLFLPNNNLSSLPTTITKFRSLQQLTLSNNPYLRSVQSLNGHRSLRILDTKHCPIELIPRNLPQLTVLYMNNNKLTKLTYIETLGKETDSKKMFEFDQNRIETVSPQIGHVRNLYRLNLCCNKLTSLPTDIYNITTLSSLNIKCNPIPPRDLKKIVSKLRYTNPNLKVSY